MTERCRLHPSSLPSDALCGPFPTARRSQHGSLSDAAARRDVNHTHVRAPQPALSSLPVDHTPNVHDVCRTSRTRLRRLCSVCVLTRCTTPRDLHNAP
ncbi:hypothetical protein MRX96_042162 [Rhipicephalus microplus]